MPVLDAEPRSQPVAHCLHAVALGGVMAAGKELDAALAGDMYSLLGHLAGQIQINAGGDCLPDVTLGAAGAPANGTNQRIRLANVQHLAAQYLTHPRHETPCRFRRRQLAGVADHTQIQRIERAGDHQPEPLRELNIVAEFGMRIERQVIGNQADVVGQQRGQAPPLDAGNAGILVFPEIAVMHEHGISIRFDRRIEQRLAGGDAGNQSANLLAPFDLQAIRAVIGEQLRRQQGIERGDQLLTTNHAGLDSDGWSG